MWIRSRCGTDGCSGSVALRAAGDLGVEGGCPECGALWTLTGGNMVHTGTRPIHSSSATRRGVPAVARKHDLLFGRTGPW